MKQRVLWALRQNFIPGLFLWGFGLSLVLCFYYVNASRPWFEGIIKLKMAYGYAYSAFSTALFGGLIPYLFMRVSRRDTVGNAWGMGTIFVGYWALRGMDVDAFYRLQAFLFGHGVDWKTIITKVLVDQFVYCVIWATPVTALFYGWKEAGYCFRRWKQEQSARDFLDKVIIFTITTWMVWTPATAIIYSLPSALQIPLFNLTLCFFCAPGECVWEKIG